MTVRANKKNQAKRAAHFPIRTAIHCGPEIEDDCQTGETENISGSEVLFVRDLLTVNKALVLKFPLPTEIGSEAGAIMLCCGHIVRTILPPVSDLPAPMAAQFNDYQLTLRGSTEAEKSK
ncbi:MAG: hypothetical protein DMG21_22405 [Acidobacteria bacterium]|nr:MAG: hypothetical protein DMG21_22405 [Acidobacteriota bacterium]